MAAPSLLRAPYPEIRDLMLPGDVLAFGGKGGASNIIKAFTRSPVSHVGVVTHHALLGPAGPLAGKVVAFLESTSLEGKDGVVEGRVSEAVRTYQGEIWWLPLSLEIRKRLDLAAFYDFLFRMRGRKYDFRQAVLSGLDRLDDRSWIFDSPTLAEEDFAKLFCSELVAAALEHSGAIGPVNASEVTPAELVSWRIYSDRYYQLSGSDDVPIRKLATVPPPAR